MMKIKFEGSLAEFQALFLGGKAPTSQSVPAQTAQSVPTTLTESWDYPKDTHFPDTMPSHHGARSGLYSFNETEPVLPPESALMASLSTGPAPSVPTSLPPIDPDTRKKAWMMFVDTIRQWVVGFEEEGASQSDRQQLMQDLGSGPWPIPILIMAYEIGSLQRLVQCALRVIDDVRADDLDFCDRLAAHMIPVSNSGFPDLAGTYDFSTRWRRVAPDWRTP
jgi:hypothetical protein